MEELKKGIRGLFAKELFELSPEALSLESMMDFLRVSGGAGRDAIKMRFGNPDGRLDFLASAGLVKIADGKVHAAHLEELDFRGVYGPGALDKYTNHVIESISMVLYQIISRSSPSNPLELAGLVSSLKGMGLDASESGYILTHYLARRLNLVTIIQNSVSLSPKASYMISQNQPLQALYAREKYDLSEIPVKQDIQATEEKVEERPKPQKNRWAFWRR